MNKLTQMSIDDQLQYLLSFYEGFNAWKHEKEAQVAQLDPKLIALAKGLTSSFRPFVNHVVKMKEKPGSNPKEVFENRARKCIEVGMNSFFFPAGMLDVDFLSDSGSSAMTAQQWGDMMQGDESYGSNDGWPIFNETVGEIFGDDFASVFLGLNKNQELNKKYQYKKNFNYLVNQGRGAESVFFGALARALVFRDGENLPDNVTYKIVCSNNFFDTTSGHILDIRDRCIKTPQGKEVKVTFQLINHPNKKVKEGTYQESDTYLGNGDLNALRVLIESSPETGDGSIGVIFTTITNNSGGSQPVSLDHIKAVSDLARKHKILYMMDACRFAENSYMIKKLEKSDKSIKEIVHETFNFVDGFTISLKKDGLSNCGGALCFKPSSERVQAFIDMQKGNESYCILQTIMDTVILQIGHFTYGALTGRDIRAISKGLKTIVDQNYQEGRVSQVQKFMKILQALNVPILEPAGTSAVYIDIDRFFDISGDKSARGCYYGNSLVGILLCFGVRACELGASAFSSPHGNAPYTRPEDVSGNFVRLAIPRQLYSDDDLNAVALILCFLHENREKILPVIDRPNLRQLSLHHFKMMFDFAKQKQ